MRRPLVIDMDRPEQFKRLATSTRYNGGPIFVERRMDRDWIYFLPRDSHYPLVIGCAAAKGWEKDWPSNYSSPQEATLEDPEPR